MLYIYKGKSVNYYSIIMVDDIAYSVQNEQDRKTIGIEEIQEPQPPEDFSDELYFRTEQQDAPYIVYTKKPAQMIYDTQLAKAKTQRQAAYKERSDVIAFKVLRGEATQEEYKAEVDKIKLEFPDPAPLEKG